MVEKDFNTTEDDAEHGPVEGTCDIVLPVPGHEDPGCPRERWHRKLEFLFTCIGFAVGYGNFWRFPYMCFKFNGGGAFLIPYLLFLVFGGIPLFFMELGIGQFFQEMPVKAWQKICPLFSGIGFAMICVSALVSVYYNVILAWSIYFWYNSFFQDIPWTGCHHPWNTNQCYTGNGSNNNVTGVSSSREFLLYNVLQISSGIDEAGSMNWKLAFCLLIAWVLVYFCIWRGIRSSAKIVYVTATLPYVILAIFFIRSVTLPGSATGILYYVTPQWHRLGDPKVWADAASQILYSLTIGFGVLIGFASYNNLQNNIYRDSLIIAFVNCGTSVFAGFVIFATVGYMAQTQGKSVDEVASEGPGLVFIVYPATLAQLPAPQFWSVVFFLMLITLGLDSQVEIVAAALTEHYPQQLQQYRELVVLVLCCVMYLMGLSCVTQGGIYVFNLFDSFSAGISLLFLVIFELIVVGWIYGAERFAQNVEHMTGNPISRWWIICWKYISPAMIIGIFLFNLLEYKHITYEGKKFPPWSEAVGWLIALLSMSIIPAVAIWKVIMADGSLRERLSSIAFAEADELPDRRSVVEGQNSVAEQ